ncbi:Hemerythrin [Gammaproteobacteria bacterium]
MVGYINDLHDAVISGKRIDVTGAILNGLIDYTVTHFSFEEELMEKHLYSDYRAHKKIHDEFVKQLLCMNEKYSSGDKKISRELLWFLQDWLRNHIMVIDKKFGTFLTKKGVKIAA